MKYRKKPVIFEASQFLEGLALPPGVKPKQGGGGFFVTTIQRRDVTISPGEWAIDEGDGIHFYPCANDVFWKNNELCGP